MNFAPFAFSKLVEEDLIEFVEASQQQKDLNANCNLLEYEKWRQINPMRSIIEQKVKKKVENENSLVTINLDSSDDEYIPEQEPKINEDEEKLNPRPNLLTKSTVDDIIFAVRENLETKSTLSDSVLTDLKLLGSEDCQKLFQSLSYKLNNEGILHIGACLKDNTISNDSLISSFIQHIVILKAQEGECEGLAALLNEYAFKYPKIMQEEFLKKLLKADKREETKLILRYLTKLHQEFRAILFREMVFNVENLKDSHLQLIENLMTDQIENDVLHKLVELLLNVAENYSSDKIFGKLLLNILQRLGQGAIHLEQPLKRLVSGHKSAWRAKLQKTLDDCIRDNMSFTQSIRY